MTIEPDRKDWTWVLEQPCPECGLRAGDVDPRSVAGRVRDAVPRWRGVLERDDAAARPSPGTWSPSEYACHVRDVCDVFDERVRLMLDQDDPGFANWDQDATALERRYAEQDPATVAPELDAAAQRVASVFDQVPADAWDRTGRRSNGSVFTIGTLAQYFWHDVEHHLRDVGA